MEVKGIKNHQIHLTGVNQQCSCTHQQTIAQVLNG